MSRNPGLYIENPTYDFDKMNLSQQILDLLEFHQTAISRKAASVPTRYLLDNDLIKGDVLDFGCGRGFDTDELGAVGYDPNSEDFAAFPTGKFDTIVCNYVLNVVPPDAQEEIIEQIKSLMKDDATAYISVRRDVVKESDQEGQTQWYVELPFDVLKESASFCIYRLTNQPQESGSVNSLGAIPNGKLHKRKHPKTKVVASRSESLLTEFVINRFHVKPI